MKKTSVRPPPAAPKPAARKRSWMEYGMLVALLVAVTAVWYRYRPVEELSAEAVATQRPQMQQPSYWKAAAQVPVTELERGAKKIFKADDDELRAQPHVFRNTPMHRAWPGLKDWNMKHLMNKLGEEFLLENVMHTTDPVVRLYRESINGEKYPRIDVVEELVSMSLEELVEHQANPTKEGYDVAVLFTSKLGPLTSDVDNLTSVVDSRMFGLRKDVNASDISQAIYLMSPGVTLQLHSEQDEHVYMVTSGQVHVLLLPPTAHNQLYLFPYIHPYYGRSQLDLTNALAPDVDKRIVNEVVGRDGLEIVLVPGDMLWVPSHWFEHMTVLGDAPATLLTMRTHFALSYTTMPRLLDLNSGVPPAMKPLGGAATPLFHALILAEAVGQFLASPFSWMAPDQRPSNDVKGAADRLREAKAYLVTHFEQHYGRLVRSGHSVKTDNILNKMCATETLEYHRVENEEEIEQIGDLYLRTLKRTAELNPSGVFFRMAAMVDSIVWKSVELKHRRVPAFLSYCYVGTDPEQLASITQTLADAKVIQGVS